MVRACPSAGGARAVKTSHASGADGYILPLVAVVVALLSLVLLTLARVQSDFSPALRLQAADAARARAAQSLAARVGFLLLTEPLGPRSLRIGAGAESGGGQAGMRSAAGVRLRELRLDGRSYATGEGAIVSVQDEAGLFNLNSGDEQMLAALLRQTGVGARSSDRLAATLADYVDGDDLRRANGAEAAEYRRAGLRTPLNRNMVNRWNARAALGWSEELQDADALWRLTTVADGASALNINTAPAPVLRAALGEGRQADTFLREREQGAMSAMNQGEALAGTRAGAAGVELAAEPGAAFRLVVAFDAGASRREVESQLVLAGAEAGRPYYWREARYVWADGGRQSGDVETLPTSPLIHAP